jgi:hypothetical protein
MLDQEELRALMTDLESDRVERTVSVKKTDTFCREVVHTQANLANENPAAQIVLDPGFVRVVARGAT